MSALVQKRSVYPGASLAYSSSPLAGSLLVVFFSFGGGTPTGVTGSLNGAFTLSTVFGTAGTQCCFAYKYNAAAGAETITIGGTLGDLGFSIYEFSGVQTSSNPLDGSVVSTTIASATTTPTTNAFTTTATGVVVVGISDEPTTQTVVTAGSGYTIGEIQGGHFHADEYAVSKPAGTYTASFTVGNPVTVFTPDCVLAVACFKDAVTVTPSPPPARQLAPTQRAA